MTTTYIWIAILLLIEIFGALVGIYILWLVIRALRKYLREDS